MQMETEDYETFQKVEDLLLSDRNPSTADIKLLVDASMNILIREPNIVIKHPPMIVVGDIHGQFSDLKKIFVQFGHPRTKSYLFLGDYVDRGPNSVNVICLLLLYKILYAQNVCLLLGNHELRRVNAEYGFLDETTKKYKSILVYELFNHVFNCLPIACICHNTYFAHGGISSELSALTKLSKENRWQLCVHSKIISDIIWSDPDKGLSHFKEGARGTSGVCYGQEAVRNFLLMNNLRGIVRSHQVVRTGFEILFDEQTVVTVWSAPFYLSTMSLGVVLHYTGKKITPFDFIRIE